MVEITRTKMKCPRCKDVTPHIIKPKDSWMGYTCVNCGYVIYFKRDNER